MNAAQFKIVKTFLDFPLVTPQRLAKAWHIDPVRVRRAAVARDFQHYEEMADEDVNLLWDQLFGKAR